MDVANFLQSVEILKAAKPLFDDGSNPLMLAFLGAAATLAGALAAYVPNSLLARNLRKAQARSTAYQIHAELKATLKLTEHRGYRKGLEAVVKGFDEGMFDRYSLTVQIPDDRFLVYKANLTNLGLLPPKLQGEVVMLYQIMESIAQDIKPGGFLNTPPASRAEFYEALSLYDHADKLANAVIKSLEQMYSDLMQ